MIKNNILVVLSMGIFIFVVNYRAVEGNEISCDTSTTLEDLTECILVHMPSSNSEQYQIPNSAELVELNHLIQNILSGTCDMSAVPSSLNLVYEVKNFIDTDNGKHYCIIREKEDSNEDGFVDKGWGTVVINQDFAQAITIQSAHPKYDVNTAIQSTVIFKGTNAHVLQIAGAHRYANASASVCQSSYKESDVAHNKDNFFQLVTEQILEEYNDIFIQFHGMGSASCPNVDGYITHGMEDAPISDDFIVKLKNEFNDLNDTPVIITPGESLTCSLTGTNNVQGRLLNNVLKNEVCTVGAQNYSGRFVHIEQKISLRMEEFYSVWIQAILNAVIIRADVDQNSTINSTDAMLTLRNFLGLDMSSTNWVTGAHTGDVNCDDDSNSTDAMLILRKSLGLDITGTGWCVD